ncbi:hypothetical protein GN244_ATG07488 [Phytophthora infestans]|uniref:Polyprotein n=1 Tax=Phytophthora infestans TaxID=4787 RepID=A0A833WL22_PHYIN|nr:hypothetical protein GN244_ATG07488 [Phytophthora infestans]
MAVRLLAQETDRPSIAVKKSVDRVFRYLNGTRDFGLMFQSHGDQGLVVYYDAAFSRERESRSSTGYAIFYNGNLAEWGSKKQSMVTLSSTEAEYIAMSSGGQECIELNSVLDGLEFAHEAILDMEDNQGAQQVSHSAIPLHQHEYPLAAREGLKQRSSRAILPHLRDGGESLHQTVRQSQVRVFP